MAGKFINSSLDVVFREVQNITTCCLEIFNLSSQVNLKDLHNVSNNNASLGNLSLFASHDSGLLSSITDNITHDTWDFSSANLTLSKLNTTSLPAVNPVQGKLISDAALFYVNLLLLGVACGCISLFGITTNILNILVFSKQGFQEHSTISYFGLTLADLCSLVNLLFSSICWVVERAIPRARIDLFSLQFVVSAWTRTMFVDISVMITMFVSVERALCVIMPFTFKQTFSKTMRTAILTIIFLFGFACYAPIFATMGLTWRWDPTANATRLLLVYYEGRYNAEMFNDLFNSLILATVSQAVVIVSTVAMATTLLQASRFRQRTLTATATNKPVESKSTRVQAMASKDMTVVKTIVLVSIVFVLCNLPLVVMIYAQLLVPELNVGGVYFNTILTLYGIASFSAGINASVNFFIYYSQGSKFRTTFRQIFTRRT